MVSEKMKDRLKQLFPYFFNFAVIIAIAAFFIYRYIYNYPNLNDLAPLVLEGKSRLLVIAPHCDDEILSSAGVIIAARRLGMDVKVVIATNGDGYLFSTMEEFQQIYPTSDDFIRMGSLRQQESLKALELLGVTPEQVIFLSYPDRGTPSLWLENWFRSNPYTSQYSETSRSPYQITYNPEAIYAGEDLLMDLKSILLEFRPDLILYPHPDDKHPDHWGLSAFTRLAAALLQRDNPDYQPELFAYLVHRRDYPEPKTYKTSAYLLPPRRSYEVDPNWYRLDLPDQDVVLKDRAVQQFESQLTTLGYLMNSFIRQNETFAKPQSAHLAMLQAGAPHDPLTWKDNLGHPIRPVQLDPNRDFITREMIDEVDLVALYAARDHADTLLICAHFREDPTSILVYSLQVLEIGSKGVIHHFASNHNLQQGWHKVELHGQNACDRIELSASDAPWVLFVGANAGEIGLGELDQIGWQLVYLE